MELRISRTDEVASGLLIAFAVSVYIVSSDFPSGVAGTPGPALFPRFIAGGIALLAVLQFVNAIVSQDSKRQSVTTDDLVQFGVPVAFLIGYAIVLPITGFLLTTIAFLTIVMYYSGVRDLKVGVPLAVGISIVLQNVFVGFLHVPLPEGPLGLGGLVSLFIGVGGLL
ncbi:tripartite tricarboxylate transporter TctB family protein [Haloarcula nitratireducens]|uniref:Tripartite tricarboxylate transporter TctB family protein n=1 Tax=Haloarcula nitratireducens TaxID=2487749 RepID=A0AAW4P7V5_9EURY|nr:tripartite tricarboxylate transporter TctB family protein [Halomicroarcula nitratireducens]MBX0293979.1 tripartite tricarboxylate transporter TctB family protein [Halomicroarcula nitratireducens]